MSWRDAVSRLSQSTRSSWFLWALLAATVAVRLPCIERPLVGNFATKNVVYAMIARNWARGTASAWYPTLDCLASGERSLHMLEWPASAYLSGWLWKLLGGSLDAWGRGTAIAFTTASVAILFLLVRRWHGAMAASAAAAVLAFSPVSIIYGQSFMLEASLVFFSLVGLLGFDRWLGEGRRMWLMIGGVGLALMLLTKIYMLTMLLPLAGMVWAAARETDGSAARRRRLAALAVAFATIPACAWYLHAWQVAGPESPWQERIFYSVRQSAAVHLPNWLLGTAGFYQGLLADLSGVVLTPLGLALCVIGACQRGARRHMLWCGAMLIVVLLLPLKFSKLNYYYLAVLPPLCVLAGLGAEWIIERLRLGRAAITCLLVGGCLMSARFAVGPAFRIPAEDRGVVEAARAVRRLTAPDEPVVTMHGSTIDLLYYCDRRGWAVSPERQDLIETLEKCRNQGARYAVLVGENDPFGKPPHRNLSAGRGEGLSLRRASGGLTAKGSAPWVFANARMVAAGENYRIYELSRRRAQVQVPQRGKRLANVPPSARNTANPGHKVAQGREQSDGGHAGRGGQVGKEPHQRRIATADAQP